MPSLRRFFHGVLLVLLTAMPAVACSACLDRIVSKRVLTSHDVLYSSPFGVSLAYESVYLPKANGETLHGWFVPCENAKGTVLIFHGNLVNISFKVGHLKWFHDAGYRSFVFDYQGFARSTGEHSVKELRSDAETAYEYVISRKDVDESKLVLYGYSLGSPIALAMAADHPKAAGVWVEGLINPDEALEYMNDNFMTGWMNGVVKETVFPEGWNPEDTLGRLGDRPVLIVHREEDWLANPFEYYQKAGKKRRFLLIRGASHVTNLLQHREFVSQVTAFMDECVGASPAAQPDCIVAWEPCEEPLLRKVTVSLPVDYKQGAEVALEVLLFSKGQLIGKHRKWLDAKTREYEFMLPMPASGKATDDPYARFDLSGQFPGWSLKRREIELYKDKAAIAPLISDVVYDVGYFKEFEGRIGKWLESRVKGEQVEIDAFATTVYASAHKLEKPRVQISGLVWLGPNTVPQPFFSTQAAFDEWEENADCKLVEDAQLKFDPIDPKETEEELLKEIERGRSDAWVYPLEKLLVLRTLSEPRKIRVRLRSEWGLNFCVQNITEIREIQMLLDGLRLDEPAVQSKVQETMRRIFPDLKIRWDAPRKLPEDTLEKIDRWMAASWEKLHWDWDKRQYVFPLEGEELPHYYEGNQTTVGVRFETEGNDGRVVRFGFEVMRDLEKTRHSVVVHHKNPVAGLYCALSDEGFRIVQDNIPETKREYMEGIMNILPMEEFPMTGGMQGYVDFLRGWFEEHHAQLEYDKRKERFVLKKQ